MVGSSYPTNHTGCSPLHCFEAVGGTICCRVPCTGRILEYWTHQLLVGCFLNLLRFGQYISTYEAEGRVGFGCSLVDVGVPNKLRVKCDA